MNYFHYCPVITHIKSKLPITKNSINSFTIHSQAINRHFMSPCYTDQHKNVSAFLWGTPPIFKQCSQAGK